MIVLSCLLLVSLLARPIAGQPIPEIRDGIEDPIVTSETVVRDGITYVRSAVPIPTGILESSGLLLEKIVPTEVSIGKEFTFEYRVQNLTPYPLIDVAIHDKTSKNFQVTSSLPTKPTISMHSVATWSIGNLGPRESKIVQIQGKALEEGEITTRGWATFQPVMLDTIKVTRSEIDLKLSAPQVSLAGQPIRYQATIKNTGSSALSGIQLSGAVPKNLRIANGDESISYIRTSLAPGGEVTHSFELEPSAAGVYTLDLSVKSAQGASAAARSVTEVRAPFIMISAESPAERFIGRDVLICLSVENTGNAPSRNSSVELEIPAGITLVSVDNEGQVLGNSVRWDLFNLGEGDKKELCVNIKTNIPGEYTFKGKVNAAGLPVQTANTTVKLSGIPALAMEVKDLQDPVELGKELVYEITVTNQGTAPALNVRVVCELEDSQEFVDSYGESTSRLGQKKNVNGKMIQEVIFEPVIRIEPKKTITWRITVKAVKKDDVRFSARLVSEKFPRPSYDVESTYQY